MINSYSLLPPPHPLLSPPIPPSLLLEKHDGSSSHPFPHLSPTLLFHSCRRGMATWTSTAVPIVSVWLSSTRRTTPTKIENSSTPSGSSVRLSFHAVVFYICLCFMYLPLLFPYLCLFLTHRLNFFTYSPTNSVFLPPFPLLQMTTIKTDTWTSKSAKSSPVTLSQPSRRGSLVCLRKFSSLTSNLPENISVCTPPLTSFSIHFARCNFACFCLPVFPSPLHLSLNVCPH